MQERLCTEPKGTPEEMLQFAVAFEEGLKRQASNQDCKLEVKSEPISVSTITKTGKVCFRCGAHNFTMQHIPQCKAVKDKCRKCGNEQPFARFYCKFKTRTSNPPRKSSNALKRINYVAWDDSSDGSFDETTGQVVLAIGGLGEAPFIKKCRIDFNKLTATIDSCSPVLYLQQRTRRTFLVSTHFLHDRYHIAKKVNFNQKPLNFAELIQSARILQRQMVDQNWNEIGWQPRNIISSHPIKSQRLSVF